MEAEDQHHENLILPKVGKLCQQQLEYLDEHFKAYEDVASSSSSLLSEWTNHCADFDACLLRLHSALTQHALSWISRSYRAKACIHNIKLNFTLYTSSSSPSIGTASHSMQRILSDELPQLAHQLHQINNLLQYLETALCLEALVGDLEDAAFCSGNHHTKNLFTKISTSLTSQDFGPRQERFLQAIKAMNNIEDIITEVEKFQKKWHQLLQSVDNRVDKTLSVLRSEALAEHRALLTSVGWPPKLVTSKNEGGRISELTNPLVLMHGYEKKSYAQSFQALCALQQLQTRRELRKFKPLGQKECNTLLWAIDELVSPVAERMEYHFLKWAEQPEFIFALVYKITRDFIVGVSDILQPLIDAARLSSYSANEAWVSSMVHMLSEYLTKNIFPTLAQSYKEKDAKAEVTSSWLHLIDLIVGFDKQMQSLLRSETFLLLPDAERYGGLARGISVLQIFCDKLDWLKMWAKIELKDGWKKLKAVLKDERAWLIDDRHRVDLNASTVPDTFFLSSREDHKAPLVAESVLKIAEEMIDRCRTLPAILARVKFVRSAIARFFWHFTNVLLLHCKNVELSPEYPDDDALVRVCESINAAKYVECKLQEWSDDVSFLEMKIAENDFNMQNQNKCSGDACFFEEEIRCLAELETNWLMEVITVLLRQFEHLTLEYSPNEDQSSTPSRDSAATELELDVSRTSGFIEALDTLRNHLLVLKINLNPKDFLDLWRSVADGLDHYISGIFFASVQFTRKRTNQFGTDMQALFMVFQPYCARPQAFFPCIRDILKVLTISEEEVKQLIVGFSTKKTEKCLQFYGISHLSFHQVGKILRNIKF